MNTRPFVGIRAGVHDVFRHASVPTPTSHPQYMAVIGPFRTMRGARFMARQHNNPHCRCVADAERLSKGVET